MFGISELVFSVHRMAYNQKSLPFLCSSTHSYTRIVSRNLSGKPLETHDLVGTRLPPSQTYMKIKRLRKERNRKSEDLISGAPEFFK